MYKPTISVIAACAGLGLVAMSAALSVGQSNDEPADQHPASVNEIMISVITPASDTVWGVEDPQNEDAWKELEDAAVALITSGTQIKNGGAGPSDIAWSKDPAWQAFADRLVSAAIDARDAARRKDLDALLTAGEVLYPPCEECHLQFHPGMQ